MSLLNAIGHYAYLVCISIWMMKPSFVQAACRSSYTDVVRSAYSTGLFFNCSSLWDDDFRTSTNDWLHAFSCKLNCRQAYLFKFGVMLSELVCHQHCCAKSCCPTISLGYILI
eukprot:6152-Pleurochrysis_carterae.AAC.1